MRLRSSSLLPGLTAVPIEMAIGARNARPAGRGGDLGRPVDGRVPDHPTGNRLLDLADIVIDLARRPATHWSAGCLDTRLSAGSTVANAAIVNEIKVQTAAILLALDASAVLTIGAVVGRSARGAVRGRLSRTRPAGPPGPLSCAALDLGKGPGRPARSWAPAPIYHTSIIDDMCVSVLDVSGP